MAAGGSWQFTMNQIPAYPLLGTKVLWGLLPPFLDAAVAASGGGWSAVIATANIWKELTLDSRKHSNTDPPQLQKVIRQEWDATAIGPRAELTPLGGPVPNYFTLSGKAHNRDRAFCRKTSGKDLFQ